MRSILIKQPHSQAGVVLFFTLIALLAITLSAIALVRSMDTSVIAVGNLAFRESAVVGSDKAIEAARTWLLSQSLTSLDNDMPGSGYYSNTPTNTSTSSGITVDLTTRMTENDTMDDVSWDASSGSWKAFVMNNGAADANTGNKYAYIVNRLCREKGKSVNDPLQSCLDWNVGSSSYQSKSGGKYGQQNLSSSLVVHYLISVRVDGPKNTVSYVQAVIML